MNDDVFTGAFSGASDQYSFDSISGAAAALEQHWSTFFTESDIVDIAKTGINALRIPIGYWAYDNSGTPYIKGADAYLEKAIGWARNSGIKVWVDCHGSPGSQNGFDNSGQAGNVAWQQGDNMDKSIDILKTMAKKYGAMEYADVVVGLQMVNEPISWGNNNFETTQSWTQKAYSAVKAEVENEGLVIVMHDGFQGGTAWTAVATDILDGGARTFGVDQHLYQLFTDQYNAMDQSQHITAACGWAANLAIANAIMPNYVGEWSAATNICVNPDGSTTAGTSCSTSGCQCQVEDFSKWNKNMIEQVRRFVEAQLDVFESSTSGYFIWAAKGPGGWGFLNGIGNGAIPNPVTERKYPNQCGGGLKRREVRGSLGAKAEAW
jgi:glucan 1,3-beta-glucosidase